jgi:mannose-6-phosphate isomerase
MTPLRLAANPVQHFYRGGARIAGLRGFTATSDHQPEEWVAATVSRFADDTTGLAVTDDGRLLRDLVGADPERWLGADAAGTPRAAAADTGLLLKLLDAGQRLPVHAHPDRAFASRHLGCPYGKTEAWYVLDAEPDAAIHLGWTEDVDRDELARRRDAQDSAWMLSRMNRVPVRPGDGILVPAGQVHAIGEGVFVVEAQEPTDFSIVLEWSVTTSGREDSHLDLGFDAAMRAVSHRALDADQLATLCRHTSPTATAPDLQPCLPEAADPFFRLDVLAPGDQSSAPVRAGFSAVTVLDGEGWISGDDGELPVRRGDLLAVPAAFGDWRAGGVRLVVARPGLHWPHGLVQEPRAEDLP